MFCKISSILVNSKLSSLSEIYYATCQSKTRSTAQLVVALQHLFIIFNINLLLNINHANLIMNGNTKTKHQQNKTLSTDRYKVRVQILTLTVRNLVI